nr:MBL fold metallo-hydrolase [Streptomyces sp. NRRL S-813]
MVVTHGHVDHFGSAAELSRITGAPIAGHIADFSIYRAGGVSAPVPADRALRTPLRPLREGARHHRAGSSRTSSSGVRHACQISVSVMGMSPRRRPAGCWQRPMRCWSGCSGWWPSAWSAACRRGTGPGRPTGSPSDGLGSGVRRMWSVC